MPVEVTAPQPLIEAVWLEFHAPLRGFVARRVSNPADVDDIVQRVFLRVHRGLESLKESGRIHAWLYRTTRNVIADHYRSPVRRHEVAAGDAIDFDALRRNDAEADRGAFEELARCLRPMIEQLPPAQRDALVLTELEGSTQAAAARSHGLSLSGMKSRVQRARRSLRDAILECCYVARDRRGGVMSYERREPACCQAAQ
jgi:RNA polymerase sigma-70 factor (ECF subfamily)